ncbi:Torus domain-containing protein [Giardia muris]|uniref:Torus domain-containing protein n=1 Tax=Giardia muris TaxID=5742 RepID=A0A4Z1SR97_GIAMU|nr:Torus domain-containing protein [Giardia muris]|eukprot:TNJ28240.1 Torus domain-containing protein [Giardia muris]
MSLPPSRPQDEYNLYYESYNGRPTRNEARNTGWVFGFEEETMGKLPPICLDYAHGTCDRGKNCIRLHRLPKGTDETLPHSLDIFGRPRLAIGDGNTFTAERKTVWVPNGPKWVFTLLSRLGPVVAIDMHQHLLEYNHRIYCEFAIEALGRQPLARLATFLDMKSESTDHLRLQWSIQNLMTADKEHLLDLY